MSRSGASSMMAVRPAVAAGCGLLAAPLFVLPAAQRAPALRASAESAVQQPVAPGALPGRVPAVALGAAGVAVAAAFARGRARATKTARAAFDPTKQLGVQEPVGFWDPAGFCNDGDEALFKRRRAVEIKHGRVAMIATIGFIAPEYFRFPGELSPSLGVKFEDVPNGLAAFSKVPVLGWLQILLFAGFCELNGLRLNGRFDEKNPVSIGFQKDASQDTEPGNYGLGFLGACGLFGSIKDPAKRARSLNAEIANGRLAMFAIIGLFFQNGVTGTTGSELYGFGENSFTIIGKILVPSLLAFAIAGENFRRGPDEKFKKYFSAKE